jgi:excisionase family DNA binding protein
MSSDLTFTEPFQPTDTDVAAAREAKRALTHLTEQDRPVQVQAIEAAGGHGEAALLPQTAVRLLIDVLGQIADGNAVSIVPVQAELTTQQAADLLNVSRPFLIGLLEKGELPFHKVGTHRRVRFGDLMAYRRREHEARHQALDELARQGQELGLGY